MSHRHPYLPPSYSTYVMGCRCFGCRLANAAYHQAYRLRHLTLDNKLRGG